MINNTIKMAETYVNRLQINLALQIAAGIRFIPVQKWATTHKSDPDANKRCRNQRGDKNLTVHQESTKMSRTQKNSKF